MESGYQFKEQLAGFQRTPPMLMRSSVKQFAESNHARNARRETGQGEKETVLFGNQGANRLKYVE